MGLCLYMYLCCDVILWAVSNCWDVNFACVYLLQWGWLNNLSWVWFIIKLCIYKFVTSNTFICHDTIVFYVHFMWAYKLSHTLVLRQPEKHPHWCPSERTSATIHPCMDNTSDVWMNHTSDYTFYCLEHVLCKKLWKSVFLSGFIKFSAFIWQPKFKLWQFSYSQRRHSYPSSGRRSAIQCI